MADLLLGLGAAVVKAACKVWLKDSEFAGNASSEVVDVVRVKILRRESLIIRQFAEVLDRLELFGVMVSESVRGYPLSTAYISLAVSGDTLRGDAEFTRPDDGQAGRAVGGPLRIDDALASTPRLFLRGEAGSGKTTLLQWLAVRAARRDFPERL